MPVKNEIGNTYGYLTVIERAENTKEGRAQWKCKCKCGNELIVLGKHLRSGNTKSCGCYQKERAIASNLARGGDLTGKRFGKLVVLKEDGYITHPNGKRNRLWLCQCDCGNQCRVQHQYLNFGDTSSCGCINSKGNMTIHRLLTKKGIKFDNEYTFDDLFGDGGRQLRFDFAILNEDNSLKALIEYQGDIHYDTNHHGWNTQESFERRQKYDQRKLEYCNKNNIKLFYITYKDDIEERLEEILNGL